MVFPHAIVVDRSAVLCAMGLAGTASGEQTQKLLAAGCEEIEASAAPRWVYKRFAVADGPVLKEANFALPGEDIKKLLAGCTACLLLGLTLGTEVERSIRAAEAVDIGRAVWMDTCASVLVEQYADEAEHLLRKWAEREGEYITGRFSPGYGDLPLALQADMLRLLDAPRQTGLSVNQSGILLPRKSITAFLGVAPYPVTGYRAGCETCMLLEKCEARGEGKHCGKSNI